jgi:TorA maturation chaperone TorD/Pyruvate/2-oxoacid:ferredoxin oxidoreductase delta subunit
VDANTARQRSRAYAGLARAFSQAEPGLEQEYTRLFVGPGPPVAHPYESVYREGRTMGRSTLDVRRQLVEEGVAPEGRTLPDHIGIELAFMAHLADREALAWETRDLDTGRAYVDRQVAFLRDHLLAWLPQFCRRLLAGRPHAHYASLARYAESFVMGDVSRVEEWLGGDSTAATGPVARREWWSVTVGKECTLCDICTQVCRPGALRRAHSDLRDEVSLHFETALCDGCAACQHWCPEKAVRVRRVPDGERPAGGELVRSAMLACPQCGQLHAPAALVTKVQAQMSPGDEALRKRLALCHGCRVQDVPVRRGSTSTSR